MTGGPHGDPASLIDAAQKAAAEGDFLTAERLLRDAAARQEATLGSSDPDLATTLNNLAFVCERTGRFDEAERGYRRAHKIAVASLSPGHPFIRTSLSNLVEFCEARGIPLWTPPDTPLEDEPLPDEGDVAGTEDAVAPDVLPEPPVVFDSPVVDSPVVLEPPTSRLPLRVMAAAVLGVAAILLIVFARQGQGTTDVPRAVATVRTEPVPVAPPAPSISKPTAPVPLPASEPPVIPTPRLERTDTNADVTVLNAQLCSAIEKKGSPDWQCTPASGDLQPGTFMFYTRLLTTSETTVEHRWSRDGRVHQTMRLRVTASPGNGYRTFSATTVSPERAGEWKVELRAADGTLLDDASFRVR